MSRAADTFVEGADTNLSAHTPTGPNAGAGWGLVTGQADPLVVGATDLVQDNNTSSGGRSNMNNNLGSAEMDVQGDISFAGPPVAADGISMGVTGRALNSTSTAEYVFRYDWSVGANGQWVLADTVGNNALDEAYPGGTVTILLRLHNSIQRGYAAGVEKASLTTNRSPSNAYAGIEPVNFAGDPNKRAQIDNFDAQSFSVVGSVGQQSLISVMTGRRYV